ncbi:OmpA family protein [Pseudoalteromonas rubra]|uniref:OmpA-like domain-containing protein n=1 Tax=Pseudoalteromonas rubra TaxID=43658 RepID=A0A0U2XE31_9GAMM|nr:OmpA family protein [Pseudoalteromonas rubra]ALU46132.1 hypothetical protein AT705_24530 [Pseudoalteromonas rubra]
MKNVLIVLGLSAFLQACSTPPVVRALPAPPAPPQKPFQPVVHYIEFDFDSTDLPGHAADVLAPHITYLTTHPNERILIQGAGDTSGTFAYNYQLGLARARAVMRHLTDAGIDAQRIKVVSVSKANARQKSYTRTAHLVY